MDNDRCENCKKLKRELAWVRQQLEQVSSDLQFAESQKRWADVGRTPPTVIK